MYNTYYLIYCALFIIINFVFHIQTSNQCIDITLHLPSIDGHLVKKKSAGEQRFTHNIITTMNVIMAKGLNNAIIRIQNQ